jgi:pSer/pThr/pTyr-binding forkhead associated (FHA) protein
MTRIVLRHLRGSRAGQVDDFPLSQFTELTIGRDPSSMLRYDPEKDDLVGRQQARIAPDPADPMHFAITDLSSRNGTFVNKQRIIGTARVNPGDVIQFGPGGPEFQFDLEPRPEYSVKTTRLPAGSSADPAASHSVPPTRDSEADIKPSLSPRTTGRAAVGKATVERMISQIKGETRKHALIGGTAAALLLALIFGLWALIPSKPQPSGGLSAAEIATAHAGATVYIEVGWKLIDTATGSQVYHEYEPVKAGRGKIMLLPVYLRLPDGSIEPALTREAGRGLNKSIGGRHTGSGFVVTSDGFILTNRHVAATWHTAYDFPQHPSLLYELGPDGKWQKKITEEIPRDWVPTRARTLGREPLKGKLLEGRNDYLDVTFVKNELRIPAKLARVSNRHDVALIKIDVPQSVAKVEMHDNYDAVQPGQNITILGYPGISPDVIVATKSQDPFNRSYQYKVVPDPTISGGMIGKVLRVGQAAGRQDGRDYFNLFGDSYQLTVNSTGAGNSGGPVFDDHGRVIGIFFAGASRPGDAAITFAVPIRYGLELMSTNRVLK